MADPLAPLIWDPAWRLVLASASPQREQILTDCGVSVDVRPTAVVEQSTGEPAAVALANALAKADAGRLALTAGERANSVVLAADTVVAIGKRIYGKPRDEQQARSFLTDLARQAHEVIGGIVVIDVDGRRRQTVVRTAVEFHALTAAQIDSQIALGEWRERAGGYAIQLSGDQMVAHLGEDRLNVVGLSITALGGLVQGLLPAGSSALGRYTA